MRILLVEDDEILTDVLVQSLTGQRYAVDTIDDGRLGFDYAQSSTYDLLIIDVGLPRLDGISLCQQLRAEGMTTPILLMTAKDATTERIRGLDAGADDYLTKPFNLDEMQARVRALLRRGEVSPNLLLEVGLLQLNPVSCDVTYAGRLLTLTPKEYSLLELMMRNPSRVFSRAAIIEHLWSFDDPPLEDSVKAHIKGLRRKLKGVGIGEWVENVYGLGYRFVPKLDAASDAAAPPPTEESQDESADGGNSTETAFNQAIASLWQQYEPLMAERLHDIQAAAEAIQANSLTDALRETGARAAHKLAGVLGMFERDDGTRVARELESLLEVGDPVQLPNVEPLSERLAALLDLGRSPTPSSPAPTGAELLLVSGDRPLMESMQQLAATAGLSCQPAPDLAQAHAAMQTHAPNLVLLDLAIAPEGAEPLTFLRELSRRDPAIPAIALVPDRDLNQRVAIAQAGVHQILASPAQPHQIWEAVTQALQQTRSTQLQVLAVDDDPIILSALRQLLQPWNMRVMTLDDPQRFWDLLTAAPPDVLILDVEMPHFSGIELCQAVRTDAHWRDLPILFLTAHRDAKTVQQVFEAGGDDYVTKPIVGPELLTRLMNRVERNQLLKALSRKDPQTGLLNQRQSWQDLTRLLEAAQRDQTPFTLALLTLADLPILNVRHGHDVGDQILQRWGQLIQALLQQGEVSSYWGNGEFIIGLPGVDAAAAGDRLAPLLNRLRQQIFTAPGGDRFQPAFQFSIVASPATGAPLQALYRQAHAAQRGDAGHPTSETGT